MLKEFKEFAMKGNVLDMAVGIIIGGAFGTIVSSFVADVMMPPLGLLMGGLDFKLKLRASRLVGTATGKVQAVIDVTPAPGLLPHERLLSEIEDSDRKLFEAFDACNIDAYASYLSTDLEFYHDQGGKTGYQDQLDSLRQRCGEGLVLRRELVQDSLVVNAAPGFGAIEAGTHRFYAKQKDGTEHVDATAKFAEIWTKASGSWKLARVISYDHK